MSAQNKEEMGESYQEGKGIAMETALGISSKP
jgi:hypothetical protein